MSKSHAVATLGAVVASLALAGQAGARTQTIDIHDGSGRTIGWSATVADLTDDERIQLLNGPTYNGRFYIDLAATLGNGATPMTIQFQRTDASAPGLAIALEQITNATNTNWSGLRTMVSGAGVSLQLSQPGSSQFSISPFTSISFADNNAAMDLSGADILPGTTLNLGSTRGGGLDVPGLLILGTPNADQFSLTLAPLLVGGPVAVPVPAAVWTGGATMLGLALFGAGRRARRA